MTHWHHFRFKSAASFVLASVLLLPFAYGQDAVTLRAQHSELLEALNTSAFKKPIVMESRITDGTLRSDVYAVFDHPFSMLSHALQGTDHWCDIMILHLNVKNCTAADGAEKGMIRVAIGRKYDQPIADTYQIDFQYRAPESQPDYLAVQLRAEDGPFATRDYRIDFESIPLDAKRSFIHMSYSYTYGLAARVAMELFLSTIARNKIGFSIVDRKPDGAPIYIGGSRGVVERNTMRYYLAIEVFLKSFNLPAKEQPERRLRDWFAATERYPRQLHELTLEEYLPMKRAELERQATNSVATASK